MYNEIILALNVITLASTAYLVKRFCKQVLEAKTEAGMWVYESEHYADNARLTNEKTMESIAKFGTEHGELHADILKKAAEVDGLFQQTAVHSQSAFKHSLDAYKQAIRAHEGAALSEAHAAKSHSSSAEAQTEALRAKEHKVSVQEMAEKEVTAKCSVCQRRVVRHTLVDGAIVCQTCRRK